jgi:uncharacterized protein (TIGR02145 family)
MKNYLLLVFILSTSTIFSQSKKIQIELLSKRVDSLNQVLNFERNVNSEKINILNSNILNLQSQVTSLNLKIENLNKDMENSQTKASSNVTELQQTQMELVKLKIYLKIKTDSLNIVLGQLEKLKQTDKSNNNNVNNTNQITQTGGYRSVMIGNQIWMVENLNVEKFRNGDNIPYAKTNEEWEAAGKNKRPAWCYYDNDPANGKKYGKLYNWYAVNDPRGLAPSGWKISSISDWEELFKNSGEFEEQGANLKSANDWVYKNYNTNSTSFTGLPGGERGEYGDYRKKGTEGNWWSTSEDGNKNAWRMHLIDDYRGVYRQPSSKNCGVSVRCLKD